VIEVANDIIAQGGPIPRASIQAEHVDLTPEVVAKLSQPPAKEGALIGVVPAGGAAATAGIQRGDVITRVGDRELSPELPLMNVLMDYRPGDTAKVVLNRNGRIIETEVRFAQRS
jgi:S1-C subfamily serine protease